jgi:hypothetical protein
VSVALVSVRDALSSYVRQERPRHDPASRCPRHRTSRPSQTGQRSGFTRTVCSRMRCPARAWDGSRVPGRCCAARRGIHSCTASAMTDTVRGRLLSAHDKSQVLSP